MELFQVCCLDYAWTTWNWCTCCTIGIVTQILPFNFSQSLSGEWDCDFTLPHIVDLPGKLLCILLKTDYDFPLPRMADLPGKLSLCLLKLDCDFPLKSLRISKMFCQRFSFIPPLHLASFYFPDVLLWHFLWRNCSEFWYLTYLPER